MNSPPPNLDYRPRGFSGLSYMQVGDLAIGWTPKAACTSIRQSLVRCPKLTAQQVRERGLRTRLYLRHPIIRFASAWAFFTPINAFPTDPVWSNRAYDLLNQHPSIEEFTDAILDEGANNEHWLPQLAQHRSWGLDSFDEIFRLEQMADTWPEGYALRHENKGRIEKPEITYRRADLEDYYREDLTTWENS